MHIEPAQRLCHLPLMMDVLRRTGTLNIIDHALPQHALSDVSASECVAVLLSGVYVGAHSLWRVRERLSLYDMATVMQDATFDLKRFPEERLAKTLDDLYAFGLDKLMTAIALETIRQYQVDTSFLHFDTTTLSFYGAREREDPWSMTDGMPPPPRVVHGYSKAHRPDLKQVLFGCLSSGDGGIPLLGKVLDGNLSDNLAAASFFAHVRELVADPSAVCLVADSKGWCARTLDLVSGQRLRLLSRLPRSHGLHRQLMAKPWQSEQTITRPAKTKGAEAEHYEIMGFDTDETFAVAVTKADGTTVNETRVIPVRAVRVFSSALLRQKLGTLARLRITETKRAQVMIRDWQARAYACADDAQRAADRHLGQYQAVTHNLIAVTQRIDGPAKRGRGRPRRNPEPALDAPVHWRVRYSVEPVDETASAARLREQASFILIRTRYEQWQITDAEMIDRYRGQYHLEHGFAWLKSGADINPMFIHTPHRIAALGFIYTAWVC